MDYRSYRTKWVEKLIILMLSTGITLLMSFLFYDSKWGMLGLIPVVLIVSKIWKRQRKEKRNRQLKKEFMDFIQILSTFLSTGSSLENAMVKAEPEMKKQYGNESLMYQEIIAMNKEVQLRKPVEKVLLEFGQRTGLKDIENFGEVISFGKRGGGNMIGIVEHTMECMRDKWETEEEIHVVMSGKMLELRIMNVIPLGIIGYLRLSSGDYLDPLYHSFGGSCFMTVCMLMYLGLMALSYKLMTIQVE